MENTLSEEWRDVAGYEGLYQVSNLGLVKSLSNNKFRKENIDNGISKPVVCIETGKVYVSTREAERKNRICNGRVSACCMGKCGCKSAGGFHWRFV